MRGVKNVGESACWWLKAIEGGADTLPIPVWKCDALGGIPMLCGGMNMPGGSIAGDTWVLWLAERMSVFADKLSQIGFREGHGVGRTVSKAGRIRGGS